MATYYWVGGDGTWDSTSTTNWAVLSGGPSGFGPPLAADIVNFDTNSGTGVCTTAATAATSQLILNTANVVLTLGANLTTSGTFTFTAGTVNISNFVFTVPVFSSNNTNTRVINFGTGSLDVSGSGTTVWLAATMGGFSYTGTPTVNFTYAGGAGTRTLRFGSTSGVTAANALNLNITAGTDIINFAAICKDCNFTGFAGSVTNAGVSSFYGNLTISSGMTWSAANTALSFIATSGTQQITTNGKTLDCPITQNGVGGTVQLQDNLTMGSTRTFTLTNGALDLNNQTLSTGIFSSSNANVRSIAFGTGNITITQNNATVWSMGTATNFSYTGTPTVNLTYAGSTGTRTILSASTTGASETTVPSFNITAGSDIVTMISAFKSVNFTGFTGTLTNALMTFYGDLTFSSGMTMAAANNLKVFSATSGVQQITTNGLTINSPIAKSGAGTIQFQDALTQNATYAFTFSAGTVQLKAGATSTVGSFVTSGTTQKYLQSTTAGTQATISDTAGTASVSYLTIQDSNAIGGASWLAYAANNNVDAGNNTNWDFGETPVLGAEYEYKLRSFTQPRRF